MKSDTANYIKEAFEALYNGGQDEAKAAAETLIQQNNINGYNLLSECFLIDGDATKAASVVDAGLRLFPNQWQLWFKKANIEATLHNFASAHESYKKTLEFEDADAELISLNVAVLFCKEARYDEALAFIHGSKVLDYKHEFDSVRYRILFQQRKFAEIIAAYDNEFGDLENADHQDVVFEMSDVYYYTGKAYHELGFKDKARILIKRTIQTDFSNRDAMRIYRELMDEPGDNDKLYLHQIERSRKLVVTTLADSEEEAIGYIKEIFGDDMKIAEATTINNQNDIRLKGLIEISL